MIVRNDDLLASFREKTRCERCRSYCPGGCDPHHWRAKGIGSGHRLDVKENLLALCRDCHNGVHDGRISRDSLKAIVARREGLSVSELEDKIFRLLRNGIGPAGATDLCEGENNMTSTVILDDEFKSLLKPLSDEQKATLRELIIQNGCDPVRVWTVPAGQILIDGYHRYDICTGEGISFQVIPMEFAGRDEVKTWIRKFHLGRRNMTPQEESYERGKAYIRRLLNTMDFKRSFAVSFTISVSKRRFPPPVGEVMQMER